MLPSAVAAAALPPILEPSVYPVLTDYPPNPPFPPPKQGHARSLLIQTPYSQVLPSRNGPRRNPKERKSKA